LKFRLLIFISLAILMMVGVGSATISTGTTSINIYNDVNEDIQSVYDYIVALKGESETQANWLNETSPGVWEFYKIVLVYSDATFYINSTEATEVRFCLRRSSPPQYSMYTRWNGSIIVEDTTLATYNKTTESYRDYDEDFIIAITNATDSTFHHLDRVYVGDASGDGETTNDVVFTGNEIYNITYGVVFLAVDTANVSNNYFHDNHYSTGCGIDSSEIDNGIFINNTMINVSDRDTETTSTYAFQVEGSNNYIRDLLIDNVAYSGINIIGNNNTLIDITVNDSAHNSIEFQCTNSSLTDFYINGCNDNGLFSSVDSGDGYPAVGYNTISNGTIIEDGSGYCINFGTGTHNVNVSNITMSGDGILLMNTYDSIFRSISQVVSGDYGINIYYLGTQWGVSQNNTFIDCNLIGNSITDYGHSNCTKSILANVNFSTVYFVNGNYTVMYPLNVRVLNSTGYSVQNAELALTVTTFGLDGLGNYFVNTTTDENGYPVSPIYVPDYRRDSATGYTYYNLNTVSAEKDGESVTSAAFNPDETWYSIDSSSPNGTLITLTLDVAGEGEPSGDVQITSFLPIDTTPEITDEQSQAFQTTTNIAATHRYYVNSELVQTNSSVTESGYIATGFGAGIYNVTVIAEA
jgi:hypothetical protein